MIAPFDLGQVLLHTTKNARIRGEGAAFDMCLLCDTHAEPSHPSTDP